jgi:hypothetical protein
MLSSATLRLTPEHQYIPRPELWEPASGLWDIHGQIQIRAGETGPGHKAQCARKTAIKILYMEGLSSLIVYRSVFKV